MSIIEIARSLLAWSSMFFEWTLVCGGSFGRRTHDNVRRCGGPEPQGEDPTRFFCSDVWLLVAQFIQTEGSGYCLVSNQAQPGRFHRRICRLTCSWSTPDGAYATRRCYTSSRERKPATSSDSCENAGRKGNAIETSCRFAYSEASSIPMTSSTKLKHHFSHGLAYMVTALPASLALPTPSQLLQFHPSTR